MTPATSGGMIPIDIPQSKCGQQTAKDNIQYLGGSDKVDINNANIQAAKWPVKCGYFDVQITIFIGGINHSQMGG